MFRITFLVLLFHTSLCQAELVTLDDAELSEAVAQNGITISVDAGSSSEFSITPTNTSADGSTVAFTGIQTLARNKTSGAVTNSLAPIEVKLDVSANSSSGDPAIVATINFNDVDGASSTALKLGAWKLLAPGQTIFDDLSTVPSLGVGYITDVTGSAVISVGFR